MAGFDINGLRLQLGDTVQVVEVCYNHNSGKGVPKGHEGLVNNIDGYNAEVLGNQRHSTHKSYAELKWCFSLAQWPKLMIVAGPSLDAQKLRRAEEEIQQQAQQEAAAKKAAEEEANRKAAEAAREANRKAAEAEEIQQRAQKEAAAKKAAEEEADRKADVKECGLKDDFIAHLGLPRMKAIKMGKFIDELGQAPAESVVPALPASATPSLAAGPAASATPVHARNDVGDIDGDAMWTKKLEDLHAAQPVLSLKEALAPTFPLWRRKYPDYYAGWTDEFFVELIDESIHKMSLVLKREGIADKYKAELAAGINIYTKEDPPWYWLINDEFNNTKGRTRTLAKGGGKGKKEDDESGSDLKACIPYSKFLMHALQELPQEFVHRGVCMRGNKWVLPNPWQHDPEAYFFPGRTVVLYSWKSATLDTEMIQQNEKFCGRHGLRTMYKIEAGCTAYKIQIFSDFPIEAEALVPILSKFKVKSAIKLIHVKIREGDTEEYMRSEEYKCWGEHTGDPDIVILEQIYPTVAHGQEQELRQQRQQRQQQQQH